MNKPRLYQNHNFECNLWGQKIWPTHNWEVLSNIDETVNERMVHKTNKFWFYDGSPN